jgi:hypothetical protein
LRLARNHPSRTKSHLAIPLPIGSNRTAVAVQAPTEHVINMLGLGRAIVVGGNLIAFSPMREVRTTEVTTNACPASAAIGQR